MQATENLPSNRVNCCCSSTSLRLHHNGQRRQPKNVEATEYIAIAHQRPFHAMGLFIEHSRGSYNALCIKVPIQTASLSLLDKRQRMQRRDSRQQKENRKWSMVAVIRLLSAPFRQITQSRGTTRNTLTFTQIHSICLSVSRLSAAASYGM